MSAAPKAASPTTRRRMGVGRAVALSSCLVLALTARSARAEESAAQREEDERNHWIRVGEWKLRPDLQLRAQGEYRRDAADIPGTEDAWTIWQRARTSLEGEREAFRARVSLQEARTWGSSDGGSLNAYEAFAEAKTKRARPSFLRVGRQAIRMGDGRLVGEADWRPAARSLDAIYGRLVTETFDFEAFASMLRDAKPAGPGFGATDQLVTTGDQLYGLSVTGRFHRLLRVQLLGLARVAHSLNAISEGATRSRFLVGSTSGETGTGSLLVSGEKDGWNYGAEGALQLGNTGVLGLDRFAYAAAVRAGKRFDEIALRPKFRIAGSYASGDDGGSTYRQFDPILPELHRHYGAMDLFTWSNVLDASVQAEVEFSRDVHVALEGRYARTAETKGEWISGYVTPLGREPIGGSAELGEEVDLHGTIRVSDEVTLHGGYSLFILGQGAVDMLASSGRQTRIQDGTFSAPGVSHFAYLQASIILPEPLPPRDEEKP